MGKFLKYAGILAVLGLAALGSYLSSARKQRADREEQMLAAAEQGEWSVVENFLAAGADGDARFPDGSNILARAVRGRRIDLVRRLIDRKVDINAGAAGDTALAAAAEQCNVEMTKYLLDRGAKLQASAGSRHYPLHAAARAAQLEMLRLLLDRGADVNDTGGDGLGRTALMVAIIADSKGTHRKVIDALLGAKCDLTVMDRTGRTALNYAAERQNQDIANLLIDRGAKPSLYDAVAFGDGLTAANMLKANPGLINLPFPDMKHLDPQAADSEGGICPLDLAVSLGRGEIVKWLLDNGASPDGAREARGAPLRSAVRRRDAGTVALLLARKADPNAADQAGKTAVTWARVHQDPDILDMLRRVGALKDGEPLINKDANDD